ncbi:glycosyltransferase [Desulfonatronovibrio hydrogenovorans]|uniref:glycosyltransferase n=1 Tax=Desulfonatronovibrio hydrogenovorans TaxID=53245 RepID=UPI000490D4F8|nr:glycosyltransferase [Desulfonatronovibrio hydrogenovorans]
MTQTNATGKIKVEHVVKSFRVGGLEKIIKYLVLNSGSRFLPGVTVLQRSGPFSEEVSRKGHRVTVFNAYERKISAIRLVMEMVSAFRTVRPDIVHCHDTESWIYGTIAARLSGVKKVVFTKHGHMENFSRTLAAECRVASWFTRTIAAVSPQVKDELVFRLGINPLKIDVVYNGIDSKAFHPPEDKGQAKEHLGLPADSFVAGSVTRFFQVKNIEMQMDMIERLKDMIPGFHYLLVAPMTPAGERIKQDAVKRGLEDHVHFLGYRSDIPEILQAMDVFVLTSFSEGTSVALLEAMASGCVPVASSTGGTPNLIEHGKNGFLFEINDLDALCGNVLKCFEDREARSNIISGIGENLGKYTMEKMVECYETVYLK